jgi:hypothetical protein
MLLPLCLRKLPKHIHQLVHRRSQHSRRGLIRRAIRCTRMTPRWNKMLGPIKTPSQTIRRPCIHMLLQSRQVVSFFFANVLGEDLPQGIDRWQEVAVTGGHGLEVVEFLFDDAVLGAVFFRHIVSRRRYVAFEGGVDNQFLSTHT